MDTEHRDSLITVYQTVAARRSGYDALMWQMPMLSLTAQAFLFTVALGSGDRFGRLTASLLTVVVTLASWYTMRRFRRGEQLDSKLLDHIEGLLTIDALVGYRPHSKFLERPGATEGHWQWFFKFPPSYFWYFALWAFGLAGVSAFIHTLS